MIEGAAILAVGTVVGWLLRSGWYRARRKNPAAIRNECECEHSWALHEESGSCHGSHSVETDWNEYGRPVAWDADRCECRRYCGPVPVEAFGMQQLGGGA